VIEFAADLTLFYNKDNEPAEISDPTCSSILNRIGHGALAPEKSKRSSTG
jgi:hypothetical protein